MVSIVKPKASEMKMSDESLGMRNETDSHESPSTNKSPASNESQANDKIVLLLDQKTEESKFEKTPARKAKLRRQ